MFQRFTEQARRLVVLASDEARRLRHDYIGAEHLLLGVFRFAAEDPESPAAQVLTHLGYTPQEAIARVGVEPGPADRPSPAHIPFTKEAKSALEGSLRESLALRSETIDTGHVLLGIIKAGAEDKSSIAGVALSGLGIYAGQVRRVIGPQMQPWMAVSGVLARAAAAARAHHSPEVRSAHLLLALLQVDPELMSRVLTPLGVTSEQFEAEVLRAIGSLAKPPIE